MANITRTTEYTTSGTEVLSKLTISIQERCDSCIQKALHMATFASGPLYFCGHHFRENERALTEKANRIYNGKDYE